MTKMEFIQLSNKNKRNILLIFLFCLLFFIGRYILFNNKNVEVLKEYNSNGQLVGTNEYIVNNNDTIMHGKFVNYNDKGVKISEGNFKNGEIVGNCIYYFNDGKKEVEFFKKNTKITKEAVWYNKSGNIEKYILYSDFGKPIFNLFYNDKKIVKKYNGYPQLEIKLHKINIEEHNIIQVNKIFNKGDKLKYSYLIANIPNTKRIFKIENLRVDNSKVNRTFDKKPPTQLDVEEELIKKGKNTIRSIVRYDFNDKITPPLIDTLTFNVFVK